MPLYLDTLIQSNADPFIISITSEIYPNFSGVVLTTNSAPITVTLPDASLSQYPVTIVTASTTNSPVTVTPVANGATVLTTAGQTARFLSDGTNWYREGCSYSFKSSNVVITTSFLGGGTATYSINGPANNFSCTIADGVATVRMNLQINISGSPNTRLLTLFSFPDIIKNNFTSSHFVGGFSLDSLSWPYGGPGPAALSYTSNVFTDFGPTVGDTTIQAITTLYPIVGSYTPTIEIIFDIP